jgi:hypothetical protein
MRFSPGVWVCVIALLLAACAPAADSTPSDGPFPAPTQGGTMLADSAALWQEELLVTVEKSRIVISMVEFSDGIYISTITMFVPPELLDAEVSVNGEKDALLVVKDPAANTLKLSLFAMQPASQVSITFVVGDELLATCNVAVADAVQLSGDCGW